MLIGDPSEFAVESGITKAYERLSFRALGYFVVHISGYRYGVFEPDATMLACSFDEIERRITGRGHHVAPFSSENDGGKIAEAYLAAIYAPNQEANSLFAISQARFRDLIYSNHLSWAPDGDEAFDDSSHILQFDLGNRVRVVGFKCVDDGYRHDPNTLVDILLNADKFYEILQRWRDAFADEWCRHNKLPEC